MKKIVILAFLVLFFGILQKGFAAEEWSFGLDGGLAVPTQNYFPTNPGDVNTHYLSYFQALEASEGVIVSAYVTHTVLVPWLNAGIMGLYDTTGASATGPVDPNQYGYAYGGAKTNLGMVDTWAVMPYVRLSPWTFGHWTPFFGVGVGWSWNGWSNPTTLKLPNADFGARITDAVVTRIELGADYAVSNHVSAEGLIGFQENDPLASVDLPSGTGGMDEEFQMSLFFVEIGIHFSM